MDNEFLEKEEIQQLYSITSEEPLPLTVPRIAKNVFEKILMVLGLKKKTRVLFIKPITLGARERYSIYARELEMDEISQEVTKERLHNIIAANKMQYLYKCIATVIYNKKSSPPNWLIKTVEQFSNEETLACLQIFRKQIGYDNFLASIISITGMSLKPEEIIASENEKKTLGEQEAT